ncbi:MAG: acylphosphatase [Thermoleophilia bacterium]
MARRVRVFIEGKVQGVYFRDTTARLARRKGVGGWIRNLPDGRVEAVYEGDSEAVQDMIEWSWNGPEAATVTNVQVHDETPEGEQGFTIRSA